MPNDDFWKSQLVAANAEVKRLEHIRDHAKADLEEAEAALDSYPTGRPQIGQSPIPSHQLMVGTRNWKLGPPMRKPPHPEAMPDLRHNLLDGWAKWWSHPLESPPAVSTLSEAELWWVGPEMCDLLFATMDSIPPETEVANLVLPSQFGLVYFSKEWEGVFDSQAGERGGNVNCITWANDTRIGTKSQRSLSVSSYRYLDFENGLASKWDMALATGMGYADNNREMREQLAQMGAPSKLRQTPVGLEVHMSGGVWVPLGRSDWPHGWPLNSPSARYGVEESPMGRVGTDAFDISAQEDRRMISALFSLLDAASLATVEVRKPSRQVVRNAQRHKVRPPSPVKVVYLRRPKVVRRPGEPTSEHHLSHRFPVRAHPRMQAYGPGRSLRKLIMIDAYIKGPQDAPFVPKTEVKAWVR